MLLFGLLDRLGLAGPGWAAVAVLLVGASGVAAVLITVRAVAGEATARRAAPFLVLAPAAIWIATSTDALTMGTARGWSPCSSWPATRRDRDRRCPRRRRGLLAAFVGVQSYGFVLLAMPVVLIADRSRRFGRPLVSAGLSPLVPRSVLAFVGFSWFDGLFATSTSTTHSTSIGPTCPSS